MKDKIEFYVGIIPKDKDKLEELICTLNEDADQKFFVEKKYTFDDPDGYFTYAIIGSWEAYECFMNQAFIKSLNHYEE
jgi:hypothetical protein